MQLKYRDDITWQDMPRIERPFFAKSKLSADLSGPHPRISRFAFKNPLSEVYKRASRDIDPSSLKRLYRKIEQGSVLLVLATEYDVFSPAFIWKEDPNHKDKGQWQLSQEISSEAEFSYNLLLTEVKKPGPRGGVRTTSSEPLFPGANMADTRRAIANTAIDTANTVSDSYRKRELAEHSGRYPQLNSGVSENPMELDNLKYDDEAYGEFAGTMAGAIGMIGTRKPPKSLFKSKKTNSGMEFDNTFNSDIARLQMQGHSLERHGGNVTDGQLLTRSTTGVAPDGSRVTRNGRVIIPPSSTAFNSDELLVNSDNVIRQNYLDEAIAQSNPGATRITIDKADMGTIVGRGYDRVSTRPGAEGPLKFNDNLTKVTAVYKLDTATNTWKTVTIYPVK